MQKRPKGKVNVGEQELSALLEAYKAYLSQHKLKYTAQREAIIVEFMRVGGHISAEELFRLVKKKSAGVGLASVYRTINSLVEAGLAVERRFLDRTSVYEIHQPGHHHDHLICMRCRKIFEFENDAIEEQQKKVAESLGFTLKDHKLPQSLTSRSSSFLRRSLLREEMSS
jgi:Fur family ferric uptake transcriptional regulator